MRRWCFKLGSLSLRSAIRAPLPQPPPRHVSPPQLFLRRFLHYYSSSPLTSDRRWQISSNFEPSFDLFTRAALPGHDFRGSSQFPQHCLCVRNFSAKSKEKKWKKLTPATSKMKKTKMKAYSSFKGRFKTLKDGSIRRWKEGKRHNAHLKSKQAKRRLRKPGIVPLAYAKVMKKLNFCG